MQRKGYSYDQYKPARIPSGSARACVYALAYTINVTRVVDPYFTQYWNRLDFLCLLSSGKTVLTILDLEKMTPRIPLSDLSSLSHLAIPVCVYAKTRDLILLRSC